MSTLYDYKMVNGNLVATKYERTEQPMSWGKVWYTLKFGNSPQTMSGEYYDSCFKWFRDYCYLVDQKYQIVTNGYGQVRKITVHGNDYDLQQFREAFCEEQS